MKIGRHIIQKNMNKIALTVHIYLANIQSIMIIVIIIVMITHKVSLPQVYVYGVCPNPSDTAQSSVK